MPRATVTTSTQRHELTTLPGAYVVLKPMPYGTKLSRSQDAMKMTMRSETGPRRRGQSQSTETEVQVLQKAATLIDFRACIVDHNLTKDDPQDSTKEVVMDLSNQADFDQLDPRVGEEIASLIDELNNFEPEEGKNSSAR